MSTKEEPKKYPIGGYAPGNYNCKCLDCKTIFQGDKRAVQCESCAVDMIGEKEPKKEESQEDMLGEILANYREHQYYQKNNESFDNENSFIKSELENFTITRKKQ